MELLETFEKADEAVKEVERQCRAKLDASQHQCLSSAGEEEPDECDDARRPAVTRTGAADDDLLNSDDDELLASTLSRRHGDHLASSPDHDVDAGVATENVFQNS